MNIIGIIAAGTSRGNIAFWVYTPNRRTTDMEKHWILQRAKPIANGVHIRSLKVNDIFHIPLYLILFL